MAEKTPQTFANHTRFDPPFHFFAAPVAGISVLVAIWNAIQHFDFFAVWLVVALLAAMVIAFKARAYALQAQDRVIRLEERLRLGQLLSEPLRSRIPELTVGQLVGLRFASDAEIPKLVERTLNEKLSRDDIKKSIQNWRPDNSRV